MLHAFGALGVELNRARPLRWRRDLLVPIRDRELLLAGIVREPTVDHPIRHQTRPVTLAIVSR